MINDVNGRFVLCLKKKPAVKVEEHPCGSSIISVLSTHPLDPDREYARI